MGLEALDDELKKVSSYYNKHFLYDGAGNSPEEQTSR